MPVQTISLSIIGCFLVILLAGFLFGLGRGFNKSIVRLLLVMAMLVITFFVVPFITNWAMSLNITNLNIKINGEIMTSISEIIISLLNNVPYITDLTGTAAYSAIITVIPQMIINLVLFLVVFYILRMISMIIYWIIAGVCFNKKKTQGKNKHRLLGSIVGVIQNLLIFLVLMVPCIGVMNVCTKLEGINGTQQTETASGTRIEFSSATNNTTTDNSDYIVKYLKSATEIVDVYHDTWVGKFLKATKLEVGCNYVFEKLTTVEYKKVEYKLVDEVSSLVVVYQDVIELKDVGGFNLTNEANIDIIQKIINHCYESKFAANLINEVLPLAANNWLENKPFLGIEKPSIENFDGVMNSLLNQLASSQDKKAQLLSATTMLKTLMNTANNIVSDGNINMDSVSDLLTELTSDPNTMELAKEVIVNNMDDIITGAGLGDSGYAGAITEAVTTIFNADYEELGANIADEINVVTTTLKVAEKLAADPATIVEDDAKNIVEAVANSTVVYNALTGNESAIKDIIQTSLNEEAANLITAEIDKLEITETVTQEKIDALKAIFTLAQNPNA